MGKWIYKKRNQKGFTLIELVVVIAILGILAALALPRLTGSRQRAAQTTHEANIRTLEGAANIAVAELGMTAAAGTWAPADTTPVWGNYLQKWPVAVTGTGDNTVDGVAYGVVIAADGTVTVTPAVPATW